MIGARTRRGNLNLKGALPEIVEKLIRKRDLQSLACGAAGVAAIGLLCGAAMQPNLRAAGQVEGPQILAPVSADRDYAAVDAAAAWSSYPSGVPDYVIGTDWLEPPDPAAGELPEYAYDEAYSAFDEAQDAPVIVAAYEEPPRAPTRYPSIDGAAAFAAAENAGAAVATEPLETSLDPELAEMAAATPG